MRLSCAIVCAISIALLAGRAAALEGHRADVTERPWDESFATADPSAGKAPTREDWHGHIAAEAACLCWSGPYYWCSRVCTVARARVERLCRGTCGGILCRPTVCDVQDGTTVR
jgi:hypothetical protein